MAFGDAIGPDSTYQGMQKIDGLGVTSTMPNDVKAYVSAAVAIVAIILARWRGSPVRPEFGNFVLVTAAFMKIVK